MCAALHDESEEDTFRSQGEASSRHSVMDDEVVHENHEHRDDAQQLDAGISPPPIRILRMSRRGVSVMRVAASCVLNIRVHDSLWLALLVKIYGHSTTKHKAAT